MIYTYIVEPSHEYWCGNNQNGQTIYLLVDYNDNDTLCVHKMVEKMPRVQALPLEIMRFCTPNTLKKCILLAVAGIIFNKLRNSNND